jgi:hypothetical protein
MIIKQHIIDVQTYSMQWYWREGRGEGRGKHIGDCTVEGEGGFRGGAHGGGAKAPHGLNRTRGVNCGGARINGRGVG